MNKYDYIIRRETENDYRETENLTREAFWNLNTPGCFEHYFVHIMRSHRDFIPELDYVIELDGKVIANVMYCRSKLVDEQGNEKNIITMGPLCVLPEYQRKGFGKALLEHTFKIAESMGFDVVINSEILITTFPAAPEAAESTMYASAKVKDFSLPLFL